MVHVEAPCCGRVRSVLHTFSQRQCGFPPGEEAGILPSTQMAVDGCGFTLSYTGELTEAHQMYLKGLVA